MKKQTLLIIDDEQNVCSRIKNILDWKKYGISNVITSINSRESLSLIKMHKPQIVITDILMKNINGLDVAAFIRKNLDDCFIILISAYKNFEYARKAIDLAVDAYIIKPVSINLLEEKLNMFNKKLSENSFGDEFSKRYQLRLSIDQYISENLYKKITLNNISADFYFSPQHFSKLFKEMYDINFIEYTIKLKMVKAVDLLENSNYSIGLISDKLGFSDYRYFSRIFKNQHGLSPLRFRKHLYEKID